MDPDRRLILFGSYPFIFKSVRHSFNFDRVLIVSGIARVYFAELKRRHVSGAGSAQRATEPNFAVVVFVFLGALRSEWKCQQQQQSQCDVTVLVIICHDREAANGSSLGAAAAAASARQCPVPALGLAD